MSRYRGRYNKLLMTILYIAVAALLILLVALLIINANTDKHYKEETHRWYIYSTETPMENWSTPEQ